MPDKLQFPANVNVKPGDNSARVSWSDVSGADGYFLRFYNATDSEKCVKKCSTGSNHKTVHGLENGKLYYVKVSAFRYVNGKAHEGELSDIVDFTPISEALRAQRVICLDVGGTAQVEWESDSKRPLVHFKSDNETVATVGSGGIIAAKSEGVANITVFSKSEEFATKVIVGRSQPKYSGKAVVMLTGELMCGTSQQRAALRKIFDFNDCFSGVKDILASSDLTVGVLEYSCHDSAAYEYEQLVLRSGAINCNAPSTFLSAAQSAGFDVMVTAANRSSERIDDALTATVDTIKQLGMDNLGTLTGCNPIYRRVNGIRIALIASTMVPYEESFLKTKLTNEEYGIYSREYFQKLIKMARKSGAEYIIAYQHWGKANSHTITDEQREEARYMADCGADLIVGAHPHVIQELYYITAADGRQVPCAYSLGNFISAQTEFEDNRDSIILRAELSRSATGVKADISYIPCISADTDYGVTVRPASPAFSEDTREALERIKNSIGKRVNPFVHKPVMLLSGSVILERIFSSSRRFKLDKSALLLSQLAACTGTPIVDEDETGALKLDLEKSFAEYAKSCAADYIAVDFYAAAALTCYKRGDAFYTGSRRFLESDFYLSREKEFTRVKYPAEKVWKPAVKRYAEAVSAAFPSENIILFRQHFSERYAEKTELRIIPPKNSLNKFMRNMEEYFISLVNPSVINLSGNYFNTGSAPSDYEFEYFADACHAAESIVSENRRCVSIPDVNLWYDRVLRYYDSMTARGYQGWLLDMHSAADMLIAYTNFDFAAKHRERLLALKRHNESGLAQTEDFFAGDDGAKDIVAAAKLIHAVLSGNLERPYDFYAPAFRSNYNILKIMAKLLSMEIEAPVSSSSAELVFLLRSKPQQLKSYLHRLSTSAVDIWGSAISKEIIDRCPELEVGKYIFNQCPMLSYEPLIPLQIPDDPIKFGGNSWRRRATADAFSRGGLFTLSKTTAKWLIIDLYNCVCEMSEYMGCLFEVDDFLRNTDFYKSIESECAPCYLFEKRNMKHCHQMLSRFAMDISERYGKNIILIRADLKDRYITLDDRLKEMETDTKLQLKQKFLSLCEDLFIQFTGCCVVDISKHFYASDRYPDGGAHAVHYEDEFYRLAAQCISRIIDGETTRVYDKADENYIALRNLRLERE